MQAEPAATTVQRINSKGRVLDDRDVHGALVAGHDDLDDAFAWKEERTVAVYLTPQYDHVLFILEPNGIAQAGHGD